MRHARDLAKSARKMGDHVTESICSQDAIAYEGEMKRLNKTAASIIFKENNKVM
jgi:hypothetical protein